MGSTRIAASRRMLIAACAAAIVGCSSDQSKLGVVDSGTDPPLDGDAAVPDAAEPVDLAEMCGTMPVTTDDWERCYIKRYCESHVHCSEQNLYASAQECIELSNAISGGALEFDVRERERAVTDGRAAIDVDAFTRCLGELSPRRCSTAGTAASCALRYTGSIADGQPCYSDVECTSPGARCEPADCGGACCTGTCIPRKKLGEPCADFGACEPGLVCSVTSHTCVAGDVGTACARYDCDAANWCKDGLCAADLPEGAPCDSLLQCGGETVCVGVMRTVGSATCRRVTQPGDPCDWFCLGNLTCDLSSPQGLGVCRALPRHDEGCSAFTPCVGVHERCSMQGTCVTRKGVNEPCTDGECEPGLFCTDQLEATNPICRAPFADGESGCKQDSHCASHLCDGSATNVGQCLPARATCP